MNQLLKAQQTAGLNLDLLVKRERSIDLGQVQGKTCIFAQGFEQQSTALTRSRRLTGYPFPVSQIEALAPAAGGSAR